MFNQTIQDKFPETLAFLKEVSDMADLKYRYGEDNCIAAEFDQIANDSHSVLTSIMARAYRLKERIELLND